MSYRRVTYEDRIRIAEFIRAEKSDTEMALILGFHKSTIGREIKRNSGGRGYNFKQAESFATQRESLKHCSLKMTPDLIKKISKKLSIKWSPEQISYRLKKEKKLGVGVETIYKFVYDDKKSGGDLWKNLRRGHRSRKPRFPRVNSRGKIKDATEISSRPKVINDRERLGDWERDLMLGLDRSSSIVAFVDRKSRYNVFEKVNKKTSKNVTLATLKALKKLPVKSITNDRGLEFSGHKECSKKLGVKIFFCDPYRSSQRGSNENRIGVLRQYYPKKFDLRSVSIEEIKKAQMEINNRPMKCLDWKTPYEIMFRKSCTTEW